MNQAFPSPQVVSAALLGSPGLIKTDRALAHLHMLLKELQRCLLSSLLRNSPGFGNRVLEMALVCDISIRCIFSY